MIDFKHFNNTGLVNAITAVYKSEIKNNELQPANEIIKQNNEQKHNMNVNQSLQICNIDVLGQS